MDDTNQAPSAPDAAADPSINVETVTYTDGTTATGTPPLPEQSPAQQDAAGQAPDPTPGVEPPPADAGTPATSEPQPNVPSNIRELVHAWALPEIAFDAPWWRTDVAPGAIEHFMDEAENALGIAERRYMAIVSDLGGFLHKVHMVGFGGE